MNQRGFATLEVILMIMVIGILASIAVPRFTSVTTAANTAKIQSDLTTIDTAIAIYYMEYGKYPEDIYKLKDYVNGIGNNKSDTTLKPPSGKCYSKGNTTPADIENEYTIEIVDETTGEKRAVCGTGNTADKFYIPKKT